MLLTPHTVVGIAIATNIQNPFIAVPLAFVFHFLGDLMPHWDFYTGVPREERFRGWIPLAVMGDLVTGVAIGLTASLQALWVQNSTALAINIFLCGIASVLPDVLTGPSLYLKKPAGIFKLVHKLQSNFQSPASLPWGILTQVLVVLVSVATILR